MALAASKNILEKYIPEAYREDFPATDSTQYYRGGLVALVGGKLVKPTTATAAATGIFVCEDENLTGVSTTDLIGVRTGMFKLLNGDSIVATDIGKIAYIGASGDDTAYKAGAAATDVVIGTIEGVDGATAPGGAGVWVKVLGNRVIVQATGGSGTSGA
jgi:hypothetical protein